MTSVVPTTPRFGGKDSKALGPVASPLDPRDPELGPPAREALRKGSVSWLKNTEVRDMLLYHSRFRVKIAKDPPWLPAGGSIFLFDRKAVRFFRKDGHNWRKKPDGKSVRETHEKLKVGNLDVLNCYYAHADLEDGQQLQRRAYWLLDLTEDKDLVLVHYLHIVKPPPAGSEPLDTSSATPGSARASAPTRFQNPAATDMLADTVPGSLSRAPSPMQHSDREPSFPGHSSRGSCSSPSPMMLDLQAPAASLPPPDPYMPLLPSMSLDSFFTAVDDHQGHSLRPLPSNGSSINLEPIILDSFSDAAELQPGVPMDSLTLPANLGNEWRAPTPEVKFEECAMPDGQPANIVAAGQPTRGTHDPPRLTLSPGPIFGAPFAFSFGMPQRTSPAPSSPASRGPQQNASLDSLVPTSFPFPNLSINAHSIDGIAQAAGNIPGSSVRSSQAGLGTATPAPIYPMTSLDARAQGMTPGRAPLAGHVSRPVIPATLTGSGGTASAFQGAFARMLPPSSLMGFPPSQPETGAQEPQQHSSRRRSVDMGCGKPHQSEGLAASLDANRQHGAKRRSLDISRSWASQEHPPWTKGAQPLSHLAHLSDTVRRAASMGSVLSKASHVLSQQRRPLEQNQPGQGQSLQQQEQPRLQLPVTALPSWPSSQASASEPGAQLRRYPDAYQMQAEAASLKAQLASLQYPISFPSAGVGAGQSGAAPPPPSAVLASRYGSQAPQPYSSAIAATPTLGSMQSLDNAGQPPQFMRSTAAATSIPRSTQLMGNSGLPSLHGSSAPAGFSNSTDMLQALQASDHGSGCPKPGSVPLVPVPAQMPDPAANASLDQMVERTREYRRQQAGRVASSGASQGSGLPGAFNLSASLPTQTVAPVPKDSNSSGSKDSEGRAQRRFVSPFALAAAPITLDDDTDSDSKSASVHTQKSRALSPTSSMTQPLSTAMGAAGQDLTAWRSGNMQLGSDELQPGASIIAPSLGISSTGSPPNQPGASSSLKDCRGQGSSNGPIPQASIQELLVADYAPEWDFTPGGSKLLVSGSFESCQGPLFVMLDGIRVPTQMIRPGTLRCHVPPHKEGMVFMFVSTASGGALSKPLAFSFRAPQRSQMTPQAVCSGLRKILAEEVQLRLIHVLIGARLGQFGSAALQAAQTSAQAASAPPTFPAQDLLLKAFASSQKKDVLGGLLRESLQSFAARASSVSEHQQDAFADRPSPSAVANVMSLCAGLGHDWVLHLLHPAAMRMGQDIKDDWGCTPMQWAQARGQAACAAALLALGAAHLDSLERASTPPGRSWAAAGGSPPSPQPSLSSGLKLLCVSPTPERIMQSPGGGSPSKRMQRKRSRLLFQEHVATALSHDVEPNIELAGMERTMTPGQHAIWREQQDSCAVPGPLPEWRAFDGPSLHTQAIG
ncbi:hypothetical protein WJX74_000883 [Apatococcus lobatus]|uniref:CG-1 domain-containing protein n=1 Tax=Apatococcus lobatus TaxID=904363 RepID=A0AAW1RN29_9CHLO